MSPGLCGDTHCRSDNPLNVPSNLEYIAVAAVQYTLRVGAAIIFVFKRRHFALMFSGPCRCCLPPSHLCVPTAAKERNAVKAGLLYDTISDSNGFYSNSSIPIIPI